MIDSREFEEPSGVADGGHLGVEPRESWIREITVVYEMGMWVMMRLTGTVTVVEDVMPSPWKLCCPRGPAGRDSGVDGVWPAAVFRGLGRLD